MMVVEEVPKAERQMEMLGLVVWIVTMACGKMEELLEASFR